MVRNAVRRYAVAFSIRNRKKKAELIRAYVQRHHLETVILSGANAGAREANEMIVERALLDVCRVICGFDIVARAATPWVSIVADGRHLPFRNDAVDLIVSNAVIEHVGDRSDQQLFVAEHLRAATHCVITTPNRRFPIESHTSVLFKHWSADWRKSRREFTRLLSLKEFTELLPAGATVLGREWSPTFLAFISQKGRTQVVAAEY